MRKLVAVLCFLLVLPAWAGSLPLISVDTTDPFSVKGFSVDSNDVFAVAWYLPQSYDAVSIGINFQDVFGGGTFSAYLMNAIGTGADPLFNELASTTFTGSLESGRVALWDDLAGIGPGTLYLVIGTTDLNSLGGWNATTNPTVTVTPGVTQGDVSGLQYWSSAPYLDPYLPASTFFVDDLSNGQLMYDVETPEPATWLLVMVGGIPLALLRRRALRRRG